MQYINATRVTRVGWHDEDPTWLPPDGTSIFDDGLEASLERTQAERMGLRALPWVA